MLSIKSRALLRSIASRARLYVLPAIVVFACGCGNTAGTGGADGTTTADSSAESSSDGAPRVETVAVKREDLVRTVQMPGTVEGFEAVDLYAKVGGYLQGFATHPQTNQPIDIGDSIIKGQVLARLDIPEMAMQLEQKSAAVRQAEAEVEQAHAAIDQAQANLDSDQAVLEESKAERGEKTAQLEFRRSDFQRIQRLVQNQTVREELLDQTQYQRDAAEAALQTVEARIRTAESKLLAARANVKKANADLTTAEAKVTAAKADFDYVKTLMDYSVIRAPFDGMITDRWVHRGDFIQPADGNSAAKPLLSVARTDVVRITLDIPMNNVGQLDRGDRAVLNRINVLPDAEFEGQVSRFSSSLHMTSRLMSVEVDLPNPDGRLMPGYYGYVTVYLEEMKQTPVIPSSALLTDGDQEYVYVCEGGQAHRRNITTSYQDGTKVGVKEGLQEGDQVVRAGGGQVSDGQQVMAVLAEE